MQRHFATFSLFHTVAWLVFGLYAQAHLCPTETDHPACIGE